MAVKKEAKAGKIVEMEQALLDDLNDVAKQTGEPANTIARLCLRAGLAKIRADNFKLFDLQPFQPSKDESLGSTESFAKLLAQELRELLSGVPSKQPSSHAKATPKAKRAHLSDIQEVTMAVVANIPAGWAEHQQALKPKRTVQVRKGKYPSDAFGLDVTGDSMNAAIGRFGPVLPGETVVLVPFTFGDEAAGKIVAAQIDGKTTLKRLVCPKGKPCYLQPESHNPEFAGKMHPLEDLEVQGVVIGKL